ncbi:mechanosensitive ion channel family protein [Microscilla marina]|nr:mechanosensitive ion channel family protein [Microscilla marina]
MQNLISLIQTNTNKAIYLIMVSTIFILILLYLLKQSLKAKNYQILRLKNKKNFNAIKSDSPLKNPTIEGKQIGLDNIEKQFSVTKRVVLPLLIIPFILLGMLPFMKQIPATILTFLLGVATLVFGMLAKPIIENGISGLVLSYSKVINVGDTVMVDKSYGTIEDINPFYTIVKMWNWRRYAIPNIQMIKNKFTNYSLIDNYQWTHVEFFVAYESNIDEVERLAKSCARQSEYFAPHEEPRFWVMEMSKESIKCWIVAWADNATNSWYLQNDVRTNLIKALQDNGIKIHRNYHQVEEQIPSFERMQVQ